MGRKKSVCPECGIVVSDLRKHLRRGRCIQQHKKNDYKIKHIRS